TADELRAAVVPGEWEFRHDPHHTKLDRHWRRYSESKRTGKLMRHQIRLVAAVRIATDVRLARRFKDQIWSGTGCCWVGPCWLIRACSCSSRSINASIIAS